MFISDRNLNVCKGLALLRSVAERKYFCSLPLTSLSSKTCDSMVDTFLQLLYEALAHFLHVDEEKLLKDLNDNFMEKREFGMIAGGLSLKHGRYMAIASAAPLTPSLKFFQ